MSRLNPSATGLIVTAACVICLGGLGRSGRGGGDPTAASVQSLAGPVTPLEGDAGARRSEPAGRPRGTNPIVAENALTGNPATEWDVSGPGHESIQGFATDISVNRGETIDFKIKTDATDYRLDIYRMGYYGGLGARKVATVQPSASLPQAQPACFFDSGTKLLDCGTWAVSASWAVPGDAVSGIYFAKLVREDPEDGRASHIVFVVRDDEGGSDILFQTSDTTWQAYNAYGEADYVGGNSLYVGPGGKASKVSYNRPFTSRGPTPEDWVFNAEYPMARWLEANGYDVSYTTNVDTDRRGAELLEHRVFLSIGHDEYWSAAQRANVEAARNAGVHLTFFSGNEIYWKTRWEPSADGSSTPYRTLVCYKEGTLGENQCGTKCDPLPDVWTGLWRDGCAFTPPADGCNPENALSGQISWDGSTGALKVPGLYRNLRFWRNTSVAGLSPGGEATLGPSTLGYEWDFQQYHDSYPPGRVFLSRTVQNGKLHHLTLYRAASGALVFGAGTVQWVWGLDSNHDRGSDPPDLRMQQATVNLLADMDVQPATLQPGLVATSASTDVTPPGSSIALPLEGATVASGSPITISGTAGDAGGAVGGVDVSTDGGTTWRRADGHENWSFEWTPGAAGPVTIKSRAVDDSGNIETPGAGRTITVEPAVCPCSIWSPLVAVGGDANDTNAVELGVKFRADADGYITGIRFYKHAGNTGTHLGHLWTTGGTMLAEVTFTGETASGWQEALFTTPVAITANTTYIASYHAPNGHYAFSGNYFASLGVDAPPLHALQNGVDGPNGVYRYGASPGFPTDTFNSSNYWVDVVFAEEVGPDETPPTVVTVSPGNGASGVSVGTAVSAAFSEAIDPGTVDGTTVELFGPGMSPVSGSVSYNVPTRTATFTPAAALAYSTTYTATVRGGKSDPRIKDLAGNPLAADYTWSFTTSAPPPPPPDEGPGGPILVVATTANPFTRYYAEILRNEGLNYFNVSDISLIDETALADYHVAILGEMTLTAPQATMFSDWVAAGGKLIAMRPDPQLATLLGLTPVGGTLASDRPYLLIDTSGPPGAGLVGETIQFHGAADRYTLSGATSLATLYTAPTTATAHPAVTLRDVGGSGGQAAMFAYDLARSVVQTRQGNPAWSGQERDGIGPIRSDDLFYGAAGFDPQPDWINLDKVAIPQADEQQRLLANLILHMARDRRPYPRFWYLPRGLKAAVIMTGDQHSCCAATKQRFDTYVAQSPSGCSVEDWECVRASSYVYASGDMSDAEALAYTIAGFELGAHVLTGCADWTPASLDSDYATQLAAFAALYPSIPLQVSNRTHCVVWSDYATQAQVAYNHGVRLDVNYYYWPPAWVNNRPGFFTGSGMPMRFATASGAMIDCYQAPTQMTDESAQAYPFTANALLDGALGSAGYYGVFTANMHTDSGSHAGSDAIVASALARGVPVVSGRQMLRWLDGRNGSSFGNFEWDGSTLTFSVNVGEGARNLRGMLQFHSSGGDLVSLTRITRGGSPVPYDVETIKGVAYAFFEADAGQYAALYQPDTTPPIITNVVAHVIDSSTATITWDTDEPADSRVDYGTSPGLLTQNESSGTLVTSHSVTLTGLTADTTYHYRVTSADAESNSATEPEPPNSPLSFATPGPTCAEDDTVADFAAGTPDAGVAVAHEDDGEVILAPADLADFDGVALPVGWTCTAWSGGGGCTVGSGRVDVDGARTGTDASFGPGRSLEFVATFRDVSFQHVGFVSTFDFDSPWAIFSTLSGGALYARTSDGTNVLIPGSWLGASHRYRIDWSAGGFEFFVDGASVATIPFAVGSNMRPLISDFHVGGEVLSVAWLRLTPYAASGTFLSRVFDGGGPTTWGVMTWAADVPSGTSLTMKVRTGDVATPDGTWTSFATVPASGTPLGIFARYLQYRADLATSDSARTPELRDVAVSCSSGPDETPPVITNVAATVIDSHNATITWDTNEPADSLVQYGTSPGSLTSSASSGSMVTSHSIPLTGLTAGTTYYYRVTSADAASNSATEPQPPNAPLSFTTPAEVCATDDTVADFSAGTTGSDTYVAHAFDGEVILMPTVGSEFDGVALPADWDSFPWGGGGAATVAGGSVTVDGTRINTIPGPGFASGRSLEFVATFAAAPFQHVGFGGGDDTGVNQIFNGPPWAIFSTGASGATLQARTHNGGTSNDTNLGAGFLGSPHRYRIDWNAGSVDYYVDGTLLHTDAITIAALMRPAASDFAVGGASVVVDWLHLSPYAAAGSFLSRVFDGGGPTNWAAMTWTLQTPAGTAISMFARTGNTATPDGSWSAFALIPTSGSSIGQSGRYAQYRADLSTSDPRITPWLEDVTIACAPAAEPLEIECPADIETLADAGGCTAVVSAGTATTTGGCDPPATISFAREDGELTLTAPFSATFAGIDGTGVTRITWTATDSCSNTTSCIQTVTVQPANELSVIVELGGGVAAAGPFTRCVTLDFWNTTVNPSVPLHTQNAVMTFTNGTSGTVTLHVSCAASGYSCITARDRLHTLRRTISPLPIDGTKYAASFTAGNDKALTGGNLNDSRFIDIIDFGIFTTQDLSNVGADTTCATMPPTRHADLNGDGMVDSVDFAFIANNFLAVRDAGCDGAALLAGGDGDDGPVLAITIEELQKQGLGDLAGADLNHDGWLDVDDVEAYLSGERPGDPPSPQPMPRPGAGLQPTDGDGTIPTGGE